MSLTVKRLKSKDAERRIAAVPRTAMDEYGLSDGDYALVLEPGADSQAVVQVLPGYPDDAGENLVRIDHTIRGMANLKIDDTAVLQKVDVETADELTVSLPEDIDVTGDIEPEILDSLQGSVTTPGSYYEANVGFGNVKSTVPMYVEDTAPQDNRGVTLRQTTNIVVSDTPLEEYSELDEVEYDESSQGRVNTGKYGIDSKTEAGSAYEDIGGLSEEIQELREMVELPLRYPELFERLGIDRPQGVLMHGPPGTGKTLLAEAVANEVDASFHTVNGPEIVESEVGGTAENLRALFDTARDESPAILFIDEIDAIAPDRDTGQIHGNDQRAVGQLLTLMDGIDADDDVVVIGATNRLDSLDPALRRGGRFDREIEIGVPDKHGREEILHVHTRDMPTTPDVSLGEYAEQTHGFVGADLYELANEAAMNALSRVRTDMEMNADSINAHILSSVEITDRDFTEALGDVEPSAMRELFMEVPDVTWDDVGGLADQKQELQEAIQWPLEHGEFYEHLSLDGASGVMLHGPPGTGKTLMAKAAANESNSNFISINAPEIMAKYVGEAEERIRELFDKARQNAPAIIFIDEIDAIAAQRDVSGSNNVSERVVSQLLTELDGMEALDDVTVIATTNRLDMIDDALLRHGRFDKKVFVGQPDTTGRENILQVHTGDQPLDSSVDLSRIARETEGFVGADLEAICEEAGMNAFREVKRQMDGATHAPVPEDVELTQSHFNAAVQSVTPSVDEDTLNDYGIDQHD